MLHFPLHRGDVFSDLTDEQFDRMALEAYEWHRDNNVVYSRFLQYTGYSGNPASWQDIPFVPIRFFKSMRICTSAEHRQVFLSSGTTGNQSRHYVADLAWYEDSFLSGFEKVYGAPEDWVFLALLPGYLEREGSSLIYMVDHLIKRSRSQDSGFFLREHDQLMEKASFNLAAGRNVMVFGVTFALLELAKKKPDLSGAVVMETGGMKGHGPELGRSELHRILCEAFGVDSIHSEYGMTELLSQAYSVGEGLFHSPPWMRICLRDVSDPMQVLPSGRRGAVNVVDLANAYSCPFIATDDLGRVHQDGGFEILGRLDLSDLRGCNLLV